MRAWFARMMAGRNGPDHLNRFLSVVFLILSVCSMFVRNARIASALYGLSLGLFFYVPTNLIPLSVECVTQAIAIVTNNPFSKTKVYVDVTIVSTALLLSYGFLGQLGSVGLGTILGALLIGTTVKYIHKLHYRITGDAIDLKKM